MRLHLNLKTHSVDTFPFMVMWIEGETAIKKNNFGGASPGKNNFQKAFPWKK